MPETTQAVRGLKIRRKEVADIRADRHERLHSAAPKIQAEQRRRSAAISRKLRMLRAPGLIRQRAHCRRYHPSASGRIIIGAILSAHRMTVQQINALAA